MQDDLKDVIQNLNSRELRVTVSAFPAVAKDALKAVYADDAAAWSELRRIHESQAASILKGLAPEFVLEDRDVSDENLRRLLLVLADDEQYQPFLRTSLDRRLLASVDPILLGTLLVFVLSVKWRIRVKKTKDGKVEFEFEASKTATPKELLKRLLKLIPGLGD